MILCTIPAVEAETYQLLGQGNEKTEAREMWLLKGVWGSQNGKSQRRDSKILSVYRADSSLVHALLNRATQLKRKSLKRDWSCCPQIRISM